MFFFFKYKKERKENKFQDKKSEKVISTKTKKVFKIDEIDVNKMLFSKIEPCGGNNLIKYFIVYNDDDVIITIMYKTSSNDWIC